MIPSAQDAGGPFDSRRLLFVSWRSGEPKLIGYLLSFRLVENLVGLVDLFPVDIKIIVTHLAVNNEQHGNPDGKSNYQPPDIDGCMQLVPEQVTPGDLKVVFEHVTVLSGDSTGAKKMPCYQTTDDQPFALYYLPDTVRYRYTRCPASRCPGSYLKIFFSFSTSLDFFFSEIFSSLYPFLPTKM